MNPNLLALLHSSDQLNQFKQIHSQIIVNCAALTRILVKKLIDSSFLGYAREVFNRIPLPDQALYISFISSYTKLSFNKEAIKLFASMHSSRTQMSSRAVLAVIKSCSGFSGVSVGKQVHGLVVNYGFDLDVYVQSALMDFYAKKGDFFSARKIFDGILVKDPVFYNCLISGYSKVGDVMAAECLFDEMKEKTVASWNSMISCYVNNGYHDKALEIFERMQANNIPPSQITWVTLLSLTAKLRDLKLGLKVKKLIADSNICVNTIVLTAIVNMFVKCGAIDEAREEFDRMRTRDTLAWSAMISGYAQNRRATEALELFECMKKEQIRPNDVALVSVLSACSQLGSVEAGECLAAYIETQDLASNVYVASALLDMYSKFGNIAKARQVFDKMPERDIVSWNSMIVGLAVNGFAEDAILLYEKMKESEVKPDSITFVGLLTACSRTGLVELGLEFFRSMELHYSIEPKIEHYACIVDLFCRTGRLNEAYELVCRMEMEPNVVIWGTLLSASRTHLNVELAELCVEKLLKLEPENSGHYVLLSNIYASLGRWQAALEVRNLMKNKRVQKVAAYSWIELDNTVHKFLVGDTFHPRSSEVCCIVDGLAVQSIYAHSDVDFILDI
ncbi:PREDICTED: pentatricopeptide repeat-containing protein At1g08070, chloroplastic [Theobroma cacao]|uniref:Pentatricopeptide repeat-containing protein At1g08070, chloroplastic n=1 Tax=Theobroma cacao TaxID=3641 RepID=A0AB32W2M5_THECC|nr:PREDICTED: pentatricopeptide repeat-containing protein At1g08070, chloroplastic [Theobroma cacao]XP_017972367.1 PREDICTED: pentatricopeptide repeat-containing protein At1g08070, chloroplastic [Theobroma cacao]XP_017972368.1 PREDICTED: pentatricopeptide repeat-containing protein At1g08070, chloroplastic [Theobroma cacao]XP_017972369.1 PREDICTED: pentatricopeptide repeat-containing protein At1g08070, chloroplastic [Theobroma cacao]XP_017972370.1 PREDICTED: pentatricopeptide repeat-containing p